jgi:hypothetical protein
MPLATATAALITATMVVTVTAVARGQIIAITIALVSRGM